MKFVITKTIFKNGEKENKNNKKKNKKMFYIKAPFVDGSFDLS